MFKIEKGYDTITKTFRLPEEMVIQLEKIAHTNKLSLNQLVIQCLNFAINNLVEEDTDKNRTSKPTDIK
ncbi:hypothetical protein [Fusobacterium sp. PH5-44]|uniref:hypothetical protein n=1 Tax=unclassified Fusobacterium TaxID=2648384 RepID=UPI003D1A76B8